MNHKQRRHLAFALEKLEAIRQLCLADSELAIPHQLYELANAAAAGIEIAIDPQWEEIWNMQEAQKPDPFSDPPRRCPACGVAVLPGAAVCGRDACRKVVYGKTA